MCWYDMSAARNMIVVFCGLDLVRHILWSHFCVLYDGIFCANIPVFYTTRCYNKHQCLESSIKECVAANANIRAEAIL